MKSLSSVSERPEHPLLIIPNSEGCLLVIGTNQAQKQMEPRQLYQMGLEFLRRADEAMREKEKD